MLANAVELVLVLNTDVVIVEVILLVYDGELEIEPGFVTAVVR